MGGFLDQKDIKCIQIVAIQWQCNVHSLGVCDSLLLYAKTPESDEEEKVKFSQLELQTVLHKNRVCWQSQN